LREKRGGSVRKARGLRLHGGGPSTGVSYQEGRKKVTSSKKPTTSFWRKTEKVNNRKGGNDRGKTEE